MRNIILIIISTMSILCHAQKSNNTELDILKELNGNEKVAILMVHFGTTVDDTRAVTIDAINEKIKEYFPEFEVREAYTARMIIQKLRDRGINKDTPIDALLKLRTDGYTHILVQSSNIVDGTEMGVLRDEIRSVAPFFKEIRLSTPLLYTISDFEKIADILELENKQNTNIVFVGHGSDTPSTSSYTMLDYIFKDRRLNNIYVGTIEGYPSIDQIVRQLKQTNEKKVTLIPLLFVAGNHALKDISVDWRARLEKEGFVVNIQMKGLGENRKIQDLFLGKINFIKKYKPKDINKGR